LPRCAGSANGWSHAAGFIRGGGGKAFHLELATQGFPAREAYDVKKSFAESVDRLLGCNALVRALELTRS